MTEFLSIAVCALGTYFSRAAFILALAKRRIPRPLERALEFVAPAVLGALVVTLLTDGTGAMTIGAAEGVALAFGAAVAWRTRSHVLTLSTGMTCFWLLRALL